MRSLKFRAWGKTEKEYIRYPFAWLSLFDSPDGLEIEESEDLVIEQYTGLKDKNGKEIYENCELDGRYRVEYIAPKFVGKDMVKGDIIELYDNKFTITKEHCEISQNSERGTN